MESGEWFEKSGAGGAYPALRVDEALGRLTGEPTWSEAEIQDYWDGLEEVRQEWEALCKEDDKELRRWQDTRYLR